MKRILLTTLMMLMACVAVFTQTPDMYPHPVPEPFEPTLFNIILYVVSPILIIAFYIYYRRKKRKK